MKKVIFAAIAACALSLSACAGVAANVATPAPLEQTTVDEQTLTAAYASFDVLLTAVDGLRDTGVLVPGSARALKVQQLIRTAQDGLNTARAVQRGLSTDDPVAALASASKAIRGIGAILKGESP